MTETTSISSNSELSLQFFPSAPFRQSFPPPAGKETHVAPFIEAAAIESAATARRDDAKVFLREFTRELVREIKPSTKLVTLAIAMALLLVGGSLYRLRHVQRTPAKPATYRRSASPIGPDARPGEEDERPDFGSWSLQPRNSRQPFSGRQTSQ